MEDSTVTIYDAQGGSVVTGNLLNNPLGVSLCNLEETTCFPPLCVSQSRFSVLSLSMGCALSNHVTYKAGLT